MKATLTAITAILLAVSIVSYAYAEVPGWVKNNAGWWADGTISESEFLAGISFLISDGVIQVPSSPSPSPSTITASSETLDGVPTWVKNSAAWWADGIISDGEFVNGIQHLMSLGLISIPSDEQSPEAMANGPADPELAALEAELEKCSKITKAYKRIDCEKPVKHAITVHQYRQDAERFVVGPITYYWKGVDSEGNEFKVSPAGQPILSIRMLAENTSSEIVALNCTSPSICSYDVWDGSKSFKYSGMDFTSGQIVLNPGDSREFNILFGPNIGYGGTEFEYDPSKSYVFRINEQFGSTVVPLQLE